MTIYDTFLHIKTSFGFLLAPDYCMNNFHLRRSFYLRLGWWLKLDIATYRADCCEGNVLQQTTLWINLLENNNLPSEACIFAGFMNEMVWCIFSCQSVICKDLATVRVSNFLIDTNSTVRVKGRSGLWNCGCIFMTWWSVFFCNRAEWMSARCCSLGRICNLFHFV
jgi:hypothetical protein